MTFPAARDKRHAIDDLRQAAVQIFGSERRLRSRDQSRPGELSHAQLRALATLDREEAMTAGQLAHGADLNPATITAMLDQLEARGVVKRERSTADRRVCNVSLTPGGWELLERKRASWNSVWEEQLAEFSHRELEAAARVIRRIAGIYDRLSTRDSFPRENLAPPASPHRAEDRGAERTTGQPSSERHG